MIKRCATAAAWVLEDEFFVGRGSSNIEGPGRSKRGKNSGEEDVAGRERGRGLSDVRQACRSSSFQEPNLFAHGFMGPFITELPVFASILALEPLVPTGIVESAAVFDASASLPAAPMGEVGSVGAGGSEAGF